MLPTDAKARKNLPLYSGFMKYFPDAMAAVARVSKQGNDQHNPGEPLHWSREKSSDHEDCLARHLLGLGTVDEDGQPHAAKLAWRAMAILQLECEQTVDVEAILIESLTPAEVFDAAYVDPVPVVVKGMESSAKSCYIAGPMRGYPGQNFKEFDRAAEGLERIGYACISPADMDRAHGLDPKAPDFDDTLIDMTRADWKLVIARDVEAILSLDADNGDAVCMLKGWEQSTGAVAEAFFARWCGLNLIDVHGIALSISDIWTKDIIQSLALYLENKQLEETV